MVAQVVPIDDSSHVSEVSWDPATRFLEVTYRAGRRYRYHDVPVETWQQLMKAPSKGQFLRREIQLRHSGQELR